MGAFIRGRAPSAAFGGTRAQQLLRAWTRAAMAKWAVILLPIA
jgi:hypothetical protein